MLSRLSGCRIIEGRFHLEQLWLVNAPPKVSSIHCESTRSLYTKYVFQGEDVQAERLDARAREIAEITLGPDHPHVAHVLNNQAESLRKMVRINSHICKNRAFTAY